MILRIKILASAVPLLMAAMFARGGLLPGPRPCISINDTSVQIASVPWQARLHVSFTDDPALATVRVQISDSADAADFVVIDDVATPEAGACEANAATRLVAISAAPAADAPVIFLSNDGPADYRVFVRSTAFSARDAAALIVGASGGRRRIVAASLWSLIQPGLNQTPAVSFYSSMISGQTLRVCPEGKPVPTFPDHALS
jgi:hypothetical protein